VNVCGNKTALYFFFGGKRGEHSLSNGTGSRGKKKKSPYGPGGGKTISARMPRKKRRQLGGVGEKTRKRNLNLKRKKKNALV